MSKKKSSWRIRTRAHYYINRGVSFCFKAICGENNNNNKFEEIGNDHVRCYMQPGVSVDLFGDLESPGVCLW